MSADRTGGSRGNAGVNPPVVHFSPDFQPKAEPPEPFKLCDLREHAAARGFRDGDTPQAEYLLNRISYQHASGYFDLFKDDDGNIPGDAALRQVHRVILFDRKLQALLMEYIGLFELQFRAQYSYAITSERGAFAHRNPKNFKNQDHYRSFLRSYEKEFNRQLKSRNPEVAKALQTYGDAPTWLAVEIMTFGTLSMLYNNTRSRTARESVAKSFGATSEYLASWTRAISSVRNQCAHFGQLVGKNLVSKPKRIPDAKGDNGSILYIIMLLVHVLSSDSLFTDDSTLAYGPMLIEQTADLFNMNADLLETCGISLNWRELVSQKAVSKIDIVFKKEKRKSPKGKSTWMSVVDKLGIDRNFSG